MSLQREAQHVLHWAKCCLQVEGGVLPLCPALVRPHLQGCVQFWASQCRTEMEKLGTVQRRGTERMKGTSLMRMGQESWDSSLEEPWGDLIDPVSTRGEGAMGQSQSVQQCPVTQQETMGSG